MRTALVRTVQLLIVSFATSAWAALSPWCAPPTGTEPESIQRDEISALVYEAVARHNISRVRELLSAMNDPECVHPGGRPKLGDFQNGISVYFRHGDYWDTKLATVDFFKNRMPNEAISAVLEADYWFEYAWNARGGGYASSVSAEGWKLFHERLAKAKKVLLDSKQYASASPLWYELMLRVMSLSDDPPRDRDAVFVEGAGKFGWYLPLYYTMENYLYPWWGGDWDMVDNMVAWSVDKTKATMGNAMYARLYVAAADNAEKVGNLFKDTRASWPKMKSGFDDLMQRYPNSDWNLNAYARFACEANDRATYLMLRKRIGKGLIEEAWPQNRRHEVCDSKFGYKI